VSRSLSGGDRGTLVIRRSFRGVGTIRLASGTKTVAQLKRYNAMLTDLADAGRVDLLRAVRDRALTVADLFASWGRAKDRGALPTSGSIAPLAASFEKWLKSLNRSANHIATYRSAMKQIKPGKATVAELPGLLEAYRARAAAAGHPQMFRQARSACLAFLRRRDHALYSQIRDVEPLPIGESAPGHPQTVAQALAILAGLPAPWGAYWWTMCLTGMGPREYFVTAWELEDAWVAVHGTKRASRNRRVPLIADQTYTRPEHGGTWKQYRAGLAAFGVTPYDARRTFATWCEDAGIPERRISMWLGHTRQNVTQLYTRRELDGFLKADGAALSAWLAAQVAEGVEA
jgi:integrase